jgi:predicted AAA+ superfamily ATPase
LADAESGPVAFYDLEDDAVLEAFLVSAETVLAPLRGLVVLDEVQRRPELFRVLRRLADREEAPARFLLLGSAAPELLRQTSETLAGRVEFIEMGGFDLRETGTAESAKLWRRGGFPRSFLADDEEASVAWREAFVRTFLERDLLQLGFTIPALMMRRFWSMAAHYHGQTWNSTEAAASLGINDTTARRYLDLLAGAYMVRLLPPWFENLGKRQRRAPKAYLRDTGLLHHLLGIRDEAALMVHPKRGASWEGFAIGQILRAHPGAEAYYWSVHSGPELDLLLLHNGRRLGFEIKLADAPKVTASMHSALTDLRLDQLSIVYPGTKTLPLGERITLLPLAALAQKW